MSKQIPKVEESTKFNFITSIWIVPFIAILIAGWLAYQYFSELGPEIRIVFPKNEGLQAGQSHIKYRDVPIGVVKKIELQADGEGVTVIARMDKSSADYLNDNTKFWIVKPEVGLTGVSGLETLISGTYIDMYTTKGGEFKEKFHGMSHAFRKINDGEYFHLSAPVGYNVRKGTPLYFKNIKVGQVEYMNISLDGTSIDFIIFIEKFYVPYVHADSKFWVASALDIDISNGRLDVNVAPLTHLLHGGVSFSSTGEDANSTVENTHVFHLYPNRGVAEGKQIGQGGNFVRTFEINTYASIAKLKLDASVRYDGYDVGRVKDIKLSFEPRTHKMMGKVYVEIDTSSFATEDENSSTCVKRFYTAVEEGLRAKITPTDFITGMLFVDLVFDDANVSAEGITLGKHYPILPTVKHHESGLLDGVEEMVAKLNKLPLEKLLSSLNKVIEDAGVVVKDTGKVVKGVDKPLVTVLTDLKATVRNLNKMTNKKSFARMPDEVNKTLKELTRTLKTTKKVVKGYDNNSLITHQIAETLKIVTKTSKEMQLFLRMLNRKPNSLIFGDK
jgi:paraquat-inducible protein B